MNRKQIEEAQLKRTEYYPEDRIPFYKAEFAAGQDQQNMRRYLDKEITLPMLCRLVEKTNCLPDGYVTTKRMLNELKHTGWMR